MLEHVSKVHEFSLPQFFEVCDTSKHSLPLKCKNRVPIIAMNNDAQPNFTLVMYCQNCFLPGQAAISQASLAADSPTQSAPVPD